jgi:hypothetical protein
VVVIVTKVVATEAVVIQNGPVETIRLLLTKISKLGIPSVAVFAKSKV